ncbi:MAG: 30S ribosomal protein S4 [Candidatus Diapherotrites archaeon]|nr:30S ribosomal protein S4 [Candidatus Diapherotrites archaeon]
MGDPTHNKKKYQSPGKMWDKQRIEDEKRLKEKYGLVNNEEIWKAQTKVGTKRTNARKLLALTLDERLKREKELIASLERIGLISQQATLDDVLGLKVEDFLERRLQSIVWRKGLALTAKQARQFITHGKVSVNGNRINAPGYLVQKTEEDSIKFYGAPVELIRAKKEDTKKKFEEINEDLKKSKIEKAVIEEVAEEVKEIEKEIEQEVVVNE